MKSAQLGISHFIYTQITATGRKDWNFMKDEPFEINYAAQMNFSCETFWCYFFFFFFQQCAEQTDEETLLGTIMPIKFKKPAWQRYQKNDQW